MAFVVVAAMCLVQHSVTFLSKESTWHFVCENTQNLHRERFTRAKQTTLADIPQKALPGFVWPEPTGVLHVGTCASQPAACSSTKIPRP